MLSSANSFLAPIKISRSIYLILNAWLGARASIYTTACCLRDTQLMPAAVMPVTEKYIENLHGQLTSGKKRHMLYGSHLFSPLKSKDYGRVSLDGLFFVSTFFSFSREKLDLSIVHSPPPRLYRNPSPCPYMHKLGMCEHLNNFSLS